MSKIDHEKAKRWDMVKDPERSFRGTKSGRDHLPSLAQLDYIAQMAHALGVNPGMPANKAQASQMINSLKRKQASVRQAGTTEGPPTHR